MMNGHLCDKSYLLLVSRTRSPINSQLVYWGVTWSAILVIRLSNSKWKWSGCSVKQTSCCSPYFIIICITHRSVGKRVTQTLWKWTRDEDICDKHRSWIEKVYTVFIQRNVLALQNEPTPYTAGREKIVKTPSDVVLRTALIELICSYGSCVVVAQSW